MKINLSYTLRITNEEAKISEFGEVFTSPRFVNDMLDMMAPETWSDVQTMFFETACGDGAFLIPLLERRLIGLTNKNRNPRAVVAIAICTLWGIDLQRGNVKDCRANVLRAVLQHLYSDLSPRQVSIHISFIAAVAAAIEHHIRVGDGLKFKRTTKTFLMLPLDKQHIKAEEPLRQLQLLLNDLPVTTWMNAIFQPFQEKFADGLIVV